MNQEYLQYLNPVDISNFNFQATSIGSITKFYSIENEMPDIKDADIAIIGIPDGRSSKENYGCNNAPNIIRKNFYNLFNHIDNIKIVDIGNIKNGEQIKDTYFAVKKIIHLLLANKIFVIILGGSNDMVLANYLAYEKLNTLVNLTCIDSRFDIGENEKNSKSTSYISKIIMHQPSYLFNYTNIGYQSYMVDKKAIELLDTLFFDTFRLGIARENIEDVEPEIRNSNIISLDISAVKSADAPGNANASPNGFTGDEICILSRYAGCSDKVSSFGIYEYNPSLDIEERTAKLIGQMLWYLIDGYYERTNELPYKDANKFIKYYVNSSVFEHEIVFYKSKQTNRWWMEVKCPDHLKIKYAQNYLISCSYKDYLTANNNEIPERWLQTYRKLMD